MDNLADWRYEGVIWKKKNATGYNKGFLNAMYAPDVIQGVDGRYYLYYFIGYNGYIGVAVCDTPAGEYKFLGKVKYSDGIELGKKKEPLQFDPGVFIDDDGRVYLYTGFGPVNYPKILMKGHKATKEGAMCFELEKDMLTIKGEMKYVDVPAKPCAKGTDYEGHEFFEAASMRKIQGKYYFVYSSFVGHELCYAVSDRPDGDFKFGGVLLSIGDVGIEKQACNSTGNTHGGILELNGRHYIFYHRQTNRNSFSRQACAEEIFLKDGHFAQVEVTSCGLNGAPLKGEGEYSAHIACQLYGKKGGHFYGAFKKRKGCCPYFTQSGKDRENNPDQYIANFCDGATAAFKHFNFDDANKIEVKVKGNARGTMKVFYDLNDKPVAEITITPAKQNTAFSATLKPKQGIAPLYFRFNGKGKSEFKSFTLTKL